MESLGRNETIENSENVTLKKEEEYNKLYRKYRNLLSEYKHLKGEKELLVQSEKMASSMQLAMGVAHEINNPISFILSNLNTLKNYISVLQNYFKEMETPELKHVLTDLPALISESFEGAQRIKNIVKDLTYFKLDKKLPPEYANINNIIESSFNFARRNIPQDISIKKKYGDIPEIKCFPQKLKQVFLNLILNASDAIKGIGTITLETMLDGDRIKIIFTDTGCGIKIKYLKRIFEPFFTTKEVGKGMGLGLSLVYSIIKEHNGEITVESIYGKGTTFNISLPISREEPDLLLQRFLEV